jgi:acetylornithine deacetylase/succinyl-diaminopimelate desuccinylase-like protein
VRPPTAAERSLWQSNPQGIDEMLKAEMGVSQFSGESEYSALERVWTRPTLEVHGISGGFVGEGAKTVIPAAGKAKISLRLPPDLKSSEVFALFEKRVKELAPRDVEVVVHNLHGGEAVLVEPDSPPMRAAIAALHETYGQEPMLIREGGSIPIAALFYEILQVPVVLMGFGLPDDNLHAPNEKFHLPNFYRGIEAVARYFELLG